MKTLIFILCIFILFSTSYSTVIIVNQNGGGNYRTIQAAINAAATGDTVKVLPGTYYEQVTINKNIVVMGSGYENTIITGNFSPSVSISNGKIQWFRITSLTGIGIVASGGIIANNVIMSCATAGIYSNSGSSTVANCIIYDNGSHGVFSDRYSGGIVVYNCISYNNRGTGFYKDYTYGTLTLSYSNGSTSNTSNNTGVINQNPLFVSVNNLDFHLSAGSPSIDSGNPTITDPDGSRSDMGYFGGPDCPVFPVVHSMVMEKEGSNVKIKVKARANY